MRIMRVQRTRSSPAALREPLTRNPLGTDSKQGLWLQVLERIEDIRHERFERLQPIAIGDQYDHRDRQRREILLKLEVLVCSQQDVESLGRPLKQIPVSQARPRFVSNGRDLVADQREAERARQRLIEQDAHERAASRRRSLERPRPVPA